MLFYSLRPIHYWLGKQSQAGLCVDMENTVTKTIGEVLAF